MSCDLPLQILLFFYKCISLFLQLMCPPFLFFDLFLYLNNSIFQSFNTFPLFLQTFLIFFLFFQKHFIIFCCHLFSKQLLLFYYLFLDLLHFGFNVCFYFLLGFQHFLLISLVNFMDLGFIYFFVFGFVLCQFVVLELLDVVIHFAQFGLIGGLQLTNLVYICIVAIAVAGEKLVHLAANFQLFFLDSSRILFLQAGYLLLKIFLFLLIPFLIPSINIRLQRFFLLLTFLKRSLFILCQLPFQRQFMFTFKILQILFLLFFCFFDIIICRFDDGEQFWFCIFDCLFFNLGQSSLLVFVAFLTLDGEIGLFTGFHLFCVVLLGSFVATLGFLDVFAGLLDFIDELTFLFNQGFNLLEDIFFFQLIFTFHFLVLQLMIRFQIITLFLHQFSLFSNSLSNQIFFLGNFQHSYSEPINSHLQFMLLLLLSLQLLGELLTLENFLVG